MKIPYLDISVPLLILVPAFYFIWNSAGWILKKLVFTFLQHLSRKSQTKIDDIFIAAANLPITLMIFISGAAVIYAVWLPQLNNEHLRHSVQLGLKAATIVALILFVNKLILEMIKAYAPVVPVLRASEGLLGMVARVSVLSIGALILLDSMGVSIAPIIASLGIGSLAVALALQPTLENLFSGFQLVTDQPIMPGHFVKLESGEEGYVEKVGWRSTQIRQLANNMVIVPNKQLVNSRVLNFYYPSKDLAVLVDVGVHYQSDLEKVERVTIEVAEHVMKTTAGGVPDFKPFIRYHTFAASSINFSVILRGQEFVDNYLIKHDFIKALAARYAKEGIVIPYPITAINTSQEKVVLNGKN